MKVSFISNNDLVLRQQYVKDLAKKLDISKSDIDYTSVYTSSYLGAKYISIKYPETKKVRVVGMESIVSELESLGI
jgi:ribonucleotide monophosphatase NagD (HAD superfamily)